MSFLSVLAQAILSLGKNQRDRDQLALELSNRHAYQSSEAKGKGFYDGMKRGTRNRVKPVIEATAEAYKKTHPKEFVPDFSTTEGAANAQELSEEVASANRRFFNRSELYGSGEKRG